MIDLVRGILGIPPPGYDWLEYIICAVVLMLVVKITIDVLFSIFRGVFKW